MSPPYLPICGIYLPFQVNLYVPNSKPSNEILFCMLEQLMYRLGLSVSSMLGGLFSRGAPHSRENGWSPGCPVPCSTQIKIIANKTPPRLLLVGGTRCFGQAMDWCLLVVGSINFTGEFCLQLFWFEHGTGHPVTGHFLVSDERSPLIVRITHLAWKIQTTLVDTWVVQAYKIEFHLKA